MIHFHKLFSIAVFLIRAGERIINLSSKWAAEDYLNTFFDVVMLLCLFSARRVVLRQYGGYLLDWLNKHFLQKARFFLTRITSRRKR